MKSGWYGEDKVDHSPADIARTCVAHVRPEGIGPSLVGVEVTISVDEALLQQFREAVSFLLREASVT